MATRRFSKPMKIETKKFDRIINVCLWEAQVNNVMIQYVYTSKAKNNVRPIPLVETLGRV